MTQAEHIYRLDYLMKNLIKSHFWRIITIALILIEF